MSLTFSELSRINFSRCQRWHISIENWSTSDWAVALAGEVGEVCNAIKKLRRLEDNLPSINEGDRHLANKAQALATIAEELADSLLYIDLLASRLGIHLEAAVVRKFNAVSEKYGFQEKLEWTED